MTETIFLLNQKKKQKCIVSERNKDFSVDGCEYNALDDFLLFT